MSSIETRTEPVSLTSLATGTYTGTVQISAAGRIQRPFSGRGYANGCSGEDQVNIGPPPQSLAGNGSVNILLAADGQAANTVNVTIQ